MDDRNNNQQTTKGTTNEPGFYQVDGKPEVAVIKFFNQLDSMILKQYQIPQKTKQLVERGVEKIILDLSAVNYINSSMLGMISSITKQGKQLAIVCRTRSFPYQLLQQCQVFSFINRYDNIISAIVE